MSNEKIEYESGEEYVSTTESVLDTTTTNGITFTWSGGIDSYTTVSFSWNFNWDELKNRGVRSLSGHIIVIPPSFNDYFNLVEIEVNLTESSQSIEEVIELNYDDYDIYASFKYCLTPHY